MLGGGAEPAFLVRRIRSRTHPLSRDDPTQPDEPEPLPESAVATAVARAWGRCVSWLSVSRASVSLPGPLLLPPEPDEPDPLNPSPARWTPSHLTPTRLTPTQLTPTQLTPTQLTPSESRRRASGVDLLRRRSVAPLARLRPGA